MPIFGSFTGARMFGKGGGGGQMQPLSSGNNQTPTNGLEAGNGYVYHTFSGPGTFTVEESGQAEIMVLGGGGGGAGHAASGGGGAGGMAVAHEQPLAIGSYTITVGAGGGNGPSHNLSYSGADSSLVVMVLLSLDKVAVRWCLWSRKVRWMCWRRCWISILVWWSSIPNSLGSNKQPNIHEKFWSTWWLPLVW